MEQNGKTHFEQHNEPYPEYASDVLLCKKIHKKYGKSFYFGTFLLSRPEHDATCVLYAFFRCPDEYVDTLFSNQKELAIARLQKWKELWSKYYKTMYGAKLPEEVSPVSTALVRECIAEFGENNDELQILRATAYVFHKYNIPFEYSQAFLDAMIQDTVKDRYDTYTDLVAYMYGSASVVGLMMTYIMCESDVRFASDVSYRETILSKAQALGEAFQLTNFLRDIGEDVSSRSRIYIPLEDMRRFGVTEKDITQKRVSPDFVALMKFEIQRARDLYIEADKGIGMLPTRGAVGIRIARVLYSRILDEIETRRYDIYTSRVHLSFWKKLRMTMSLLINKNKISVNNISDNKTSDN